MNTSALALTEIRKSGEIGQSQAMYYYIFSAYSPYHNGLAQPLTHLQATDLVNEFFGKKMPARNGRIAELEKLGFLKKHDVVRCAKTNKMVNRWVYTGRTTPITTESVREKCSHCDGKGFVYNNRPVNPGQKDFFNGK